MEGPGKDVSDETKKTIEIKAEIFEEDHCSEALDGGWGWMIVFGTAICHVVFGIIVRAFGVTYIELLARYGGSATATGWIGAINMSASGLLSPLVSALCLRLSCRSVATCGGVLLAAGVIGTAFAPNLITVYFTFGVMAGCGTALAYTPGYIIVGEYFEKRKALAMSLATFASGVGAMFPPVMLYLFEQFGYSGALLIIGALTLHCCIGGMLYRPLKDNFLRRKTLCVEMKAMHGARAKVKAGISNGSLSKDDTSNRKFADIVTAASLESLHSIPLGEDEIQLQSKEEEDTLERKPAAVTFSDHAQDAISDGENVVLKDLDRKNGKIVESHTKRFGERKESIFHKPDTKQKIFDWGLLRKPRIVSLCYGIFCNAFNLGLISAYVPILAVERGIPTVKAVSLLTVSGIGSTFGTLAFGYVSDLKTVKPWRIYFYIFGLFIIGLVTVFNPLAQTYTAFVVCSLIRAIFAGYIMSQRATIVSDIVGRSRLNHAVGLVLFSTAVGFLFGRALGGVIKDATGIYDASFYIAGSATIGGSAVMLFCERWYARKRQMLQVE